MSTSFALKFLSNKLIDVDIILSITLTVKSGSLDFLADKLCAEVGHFYMILACSKRKFLLFWTVIIKNYGIFLPEVPKQL